MRTEDILSTTDAHTPNLLRTLMDRVPVGIFLTDKEGKATYLNEKWLQISGRSLKEALNQNWTNFVHPGDRKKVLAAWASAVFKASAFNFEFRLLTSSDQSIWVLGEAEPVLDRKGRVIAFVGSIVDIDKRMQAEFALRENESRYRSIVANSPVCIHEIGLDGKITSMNRAGLLMMGTEDESKVQGMPYLDAVSSANREHVRDLLIRACAGETSNFEFKAAGPSGKIFKSCFAPIRNDEGEVSLLMGITEDITERKQKEEALLENEQRLKLATASASIGIWDLGLKDGALRWDDQMFKLYGVDVKTFKGSVEVWQNALHPEDRDRAYAEYLAAVRGEKEFNTEFRIVWPNGTIKTLKGTAIVLRDASGNGVRMIGANIDVTEEKERLTELHQLNEFLQAARKVAERAAAMKSRFLDVAAHELRTPVTAFSILLQLTKKKLEKGIPVDISTLSRLETQGDRISRLVVDILDVSRLERGVLTLSKSSGDIVSLVKGCLEEFALSKPNRKLIFHEPKTPIEIEMDGMRIFQVLSNFLHNAGKYTPKESPIKVTIEENPAFVRVSVIDYGPGISDQYKADLFTPFSRLSDELTDKSGGLGLGLFICRSIIELHDGKVGMESKAGVGSTFFFDLPRKGSSL